MRIYEGSPRQNWEEALRSIGAYVDRERFKEILLLELEAGFIFQALAVSAGGARTESEGSLTKIMRELPDDEIAEMMDEGAARRSGGPELTPRTEISNFYEQALRVIGAYLDAQRPKDVFFFEQDGAFVLRLLVGAAGAAAAGHQLVEFTKSDILAMIDAAPGHREEIAP